MDNIDRIRNGHGGAGEADGVQILSPYSKKGACQFRQAPQTVEKPLLCVMQGRGSSYIEEKIGQ